MLRSSTLTLTKTPGLNLASDTSPSNPDSSSEPLPNSNKNDTKAPQIPALLLEELMPTRTEGPPLAGFRVLVVDDEPDARMLVSFALKRKGAIVETAASVQEAWQKIETTTSPFDVMVSDVGMPDENGYSLIRRIREHESELNTGQFLPAIALTAYVFSEDRVRALLAGFQAHMGKPVEPEELVELVASLKGYSQ